MPKLRSRGSILRHLNLGFGLLLAIVWVVELVRLPHLLLGEPDVFYWPRVLIRTAVLLLIWLWMHRVIARIVRRLHELEDFLRICSWCRRVGHEDGWLTVEEFFGARLATRTSHSICPECSLKARTHLPPLPPAPASTATPS